MTYKEITKRIENIDKCIELVKEAGLNENDLDKQKQWGYTVDYLCAYKNYIKYEKQFEEKRLESSSTEEKHVIDESNNVKTKSNGVIYAHLL